ncbi:hypothetical protein MAR_024191 [Mya arenaria]|uniref:Uncharacterized protein n=1 Tax=Mya arenaria TaxID=6604 RepID=A0ABY7DSE0_MYAAR|nr:hypothetical protein MAR_024191 [Mya arenaria]
MTRTIKKTIQNNQKTYSKPYRTNQKTLDRPKENDEQNTIASEKDQSLYLQRSEEFRPAFSIIELRSFFPVPVLLLSATCTDMRLLTTVCIRCNAVGDLDELKVPYGGDPLTRVRLQGVKALRASANTTTECFDHLHPIIVELDHTLQDS